MAKRQYRKYTVEMMGPIVADSVSVMEVLRKLGLKPSGNAHAYTKQIIARLGLDTSHFLGQGAGRGPRYKGGTKKVTADEVLVFDRHHASGRKEDTKRLRRALLEIGTTHVCVGCGNPGTWEGKPLTLAIDHMNGNPLDNRRDNLRFLCPNCHSQTDTYGTKNILRASVVKR